MICTLICHGFQIQSEEAKKKKINLTASSEEEGDRKEPRVAVHRLLSVAVSLAKLIPSAGSGSSGGTSFAGNVTSHIPPGCPYKHKFSFSASNQPTPKSLDSKNQIQHQNNPDLKLLPIFTKKNKKKLTWIAHRIELIDI